MTIDELQSWALRFLHQNRGIIQRRDLPQRLFCYGLEGTPCTLGDGNLPAMGTWPCSWPGCKRTVCGAHAFWCPQSGELRCECPVPRCWEHCVCASGMVSMAGGPEGPLGGIGPDNPLRRQGPPSGGNTGAGNAGGSTTQGGSNPGQSGGSHQGRQHLIWSCQVTVTDACPEGWLMMEDFKERDAMFVGWACLRRERALNACDITVGSEGMCGEGETYRGRDKKRDVARVALMERPAKDPVDRTHKITTTRIRPAQGVIPDTNLDPHHLSRQVEPKHRRVIPQTKIASWTLVM